ncbi:hypothetical protein L1049_023988 [Liquidambar formosana]|uniref:Disease resistance protein At4g27190-like leucine-rich repeats domain-containing protein n=1 Tax=Liquidambar formosana TaxID=63359 RepID=A0AAP0RU99_LIQFO
MEVQSCHKLLNVVSSNMLKGLKNLEEVSVKECDSVEIIFEVEWLTVKGMNGTGILSQLRELELWGLPKLFASKHPILQKLEMKDEEVEKKPEERNSCIPIRPLFDEWVAFTNLEVLRIINIENLQEIFPTELPDKSFSQLKYLLVRGCHKLSRVAPSNLLPRLKNLEELIVEGCNSIKKIFELEGHVGQGYSATSLFQLEKVELRDLSNLKIFFSDNYNFDLPSLETLSLIVCPKMRTFSFGFISTPKLNTVTVEQNEQQWKGDLNSTVQHLFQEKQQNKGRRKRAEARHETKVK